MACNQREIECWYKNNLVGKNDIESQKDPTCFQTYRADV